ncbi:MAG TPA: hypothetical protein ENH29_01555 [Bacteroidetes bacterium]|nr:hypothetical protein [Bacteroidota bacterium]
MKVKLILSIQLFLFLLCLSISARGQDLKFAKFQIPENPITLQRAVQPWSSFTVVGRKSFFVGKENGVTEAWVVPFKLIHDLQFQVIREGKQYRLKLSGLARRIWVRPEATTIRFVHSGFTIDATYFAPIESAGLVILLDIRSSEKLTLLVQFQTDLQPMWPGGLGGRFSYWDDGERAFIISESRWKYAGLIGSPFGSKGTGTPAHAQPEAPVQFQIDVNPDSCASVFVPVVIAGSADGFKPAQENYRKIVTNLQPLYQRTFDHYKNIREQCLSADLPDKKLSLALEWAKVALDKGLMENPQLGTGLVAGFGPSGKSARPGFAWFFGGDAAINSWAINDYGGLETVKKSLQFFIKYQRKDGKIPHEISQSAAMLPWFKEYPYAYYHAETTPFFLVAVDDYVRHSGDVRFVRDNWTAVKKAFDYCLSADSNRDGLMDNVTAGLGAVELGDLRKAQTEVDIYLASVWIKALDAMKRLSELKGDKKMSRQCASRFDKAKQALNKKFWRADKQMLSFSVMTDGSTIDDKTTWQAVPLCFDLIPADRADAVMKMYEQPDMATGWGVHFLAKSSPKYRYWGYNTGAVWPFTTMFVIWGGFRTGHADFARQQWENVANLTFTQQLGAISELFSGDRFQPIEAAVPHQLFSSTPVVVGFTRGIMGLEPDVPRHILRFEPNWPRDWTEAEIDNIPFGENKITLKHVHNRNEIKLTWVKNTNFTLQLDISYALSAGESVSGVEVNGSRIEFKRAGEQLRMNIDLQKESTVIKLKGNFLVQDKKTKKRLTIGETAR